jgi:hypothetical protein
VLCESVPSSSFGADREAWRCRRLAAPPNSFGLRDDVACSPRTTRTMGWVLKGFPGPSAAALL